MLLRRDLQRKYRKFRLGYLWTILEPLGMSVVLWFVFEVLLGGRKMGLQPYFLFLVVAILPWWWFTKGIADSTRVFRRGSSELRISMLPTQVWVLRVVLLSMAEFIAAIPIVLLAMVVTRTLPGPFIVAYPIAIIVQFWFMYGLAQLVSAAVVAAPDIARIVRIVMRALFYLSPVLYAVANIPERIQHYASLNPLVGILGLYRLGFWPDEAESLRGYMMSLTVGVIVFLIGAYTFRRLEPRILKEA